ncbi:MAG: hypothetical protein IT438_07045 [Phycisphaerales bacterium]|nr:hypothetical protein [Phycisphaerales bacterium]
MTDEELSKRLKAFQQRLDFAQRQAGVPSLVLYAFMATGDGKEPASVIGGETMCFPGRMDERTVETTFGEMITLIGYVWGRLEVIKQEQAAQYGPKFSVVLQREIQGNMRQGSAMEQFGFQTSLTDLVRAYEPAIAVGSTVGSVIDDRVTPGEPMAYMATTSRPVRDLIPTFAAIKKGYENLVEHTAKHAGIPLDKFQAMIDAVGG